MPEWLFALPARLAETISSDLGVLLVVLGNIWYRKHEHMPALQLAALLWSVLRRRDNMAYRRFLYRALADLELLALRCLAESRGTGPSLSVVPPPNEKACVHL